MKSFMSSKWVKAIGIGGLCLAAGLLICPRTPSIDASSLVAKVGKAQYRQAYEAKAVFESFDNGKLTASRQVTLSHDNNGNLRIDGNLPSGVWTFDVILPDSSSCFPTVDSSDVIAGRQVWALRFRPRVKDKNNRWLQVWVDKQNYVILAYRAWNGKELVNSRKILKITYTN